MLVRVCSWHEGRQLVLLPLFSASHSICPVCLDRELYRAGAWNENSDFWKEEYMGKPIVRNWIPRISEEGWRIVTTGGFWPEFHRDGRNGHRVIIAAGQSCPVIRGRRKVTWRLGWWVCCPATKYMEHADDLNTALDLGALIG